MGVIGAGTHAYMGGGVDDTQLDMGRWYRSKEKVAGHYPYIGYLTTKKWHLNEEMANHLLRFQQAGLTSLEVKLEEWQWEEELHVFTLEEVGLALIINVAGLGISTIVFLIEKIDKMV